MKHVRIAGFGDLVDVAAPVHQADGDDLVSHGMLHGSARGAGGQEATDRLVDDPAGIGQGPAVLV